ncbi:uncharacterized protein zgc:113208 [Triplophysa rosa]|uniref:Uncharacterized protein n=1 Tax=Triplophysa rosa TaxID=992332 RepID=A0A9W8CBD5_TRIRA|nr:uncharacterized protein zgc:113208 [Triplophysa rosa]KAI7813582.1 hypothetical protein IRJ41_023196 [Triplophysa rosa]
MSDEDKRSTKKIKIKSSEGDTTAPTRKRQKIKEKHDNKRAGKLDTTKAKVEHSGTDKHTSAQSTDHQLSDVVKNTCEEKRNVKRQLVFKDYPEFTPNVTPKEVLQAGSFGGTYFRPIYSSITKQHYKDVWQELPKDWLEGLTISSQVASSTYRENVNAYKVKCGGSLEMWESSGWIVPQDPYGWFQWYCRFYQGRRTQDDERQISRWAKCAGVKGRWRNNLITKVVRSGCAYDNFSVSPVVRQTLQHWGYRLTLEDYKEGAKRVKPK